MFSHVLSAANGFVTYSTVQKNSSEVAKILKIKI